MRTSRYDTESNRRRRSSAPPQSASRTQSFTCAADLLRAFEHRAFELGCSFDWLLEEAMQRLLAESSAPDIDAANDDATPPPQSLHQVRPAPSSVTTRASRPLPLPLPPAASLPPPPPPRRSRTATPVEEPLVLYRGNEQVTIDRHPYVIGRSPAFADMVIDYGEVSRRHALIEYTTDGWVITDLGSTNGIIVNGEVVRHARLLRGMVMTIGPMTFAVA